MLTACDSDNVGRTWRLSRWDRYSTCSLTLSPNHSAHRTARSKRLVGGREQTWPTRSVNDDSLIQPST